MSQQRTADRDSACDDSSGASVATVPAAAATSIPYSLRRESRAGLQVVREKPAFLVRPAFRRLAQESPQAPIPTEPDLVLRELRALERVCWCLRSLATMWSFGCPWTRRKGNRLGRVGANGSPFPAMEIGTPMGASLRRFPRLTLELVRP